jgi:ABC-2 type transport system permease protein
MKNALLIANRELQAYFVQPVAYVVMTVFLLLGGWFFFALLRRFDVIQEMYLAMQNPRALAQLNLNQLVIQPLLHNLAIVLVLLVPALTMRSFAEEKRIGTYELLLTSPVRTGEVVAGKFIAAMVMILVMVLLTAIFPLILVLFGNPEIGIIASGYLGLAFLGVAFASVGLFTSSLTQNQIIAAISCLGALLLLFVISWPAEIGGSTTVSALLGYLALPGHFSNMVNGLIDTKDIIYFLSLMAVALFLTQRAVESARWR